MIKRKSPYSFNTVKQVAKTADYTVLTTDEQIDVTPAANTVLTLPEIKDLAAAGLGAKAYKFTKQGTGRYSVKIAASGADVFNVAGADQTYVFINSYGDEVVIVSDSVMQEWKIIHSTLGMFLGTSLTAGKEGNISIETQALTGQINGLEINMSGPNGAATGSNSFCALRVQNFLVGTSLMTGRTAFFGLYSHSTTQVVTGNLTAVEMEVGEAAVLGSQTTAVLTLATRSARPATSYHNMSGYITIRDYSTGDGGPIPNFLSLLNAATGWTIPATDVNALFTTSSDQLQTHALKISVGNTSYWIMVTSDSPD